MPTAAEAALAGLDSTYGGAVNAGGLVSLQNAAEAARTGGTVASAGGGVLSGGLGGLLSAAVPGMAFSYALNSILNRGGIFEGEPIYENTPSDLAVGQAEGLFDYNVNGVEGGIGEGATEMGLDALMRAASTGDPATTQQVLDTLNANDKDFAASVIDLTVGSNNPFALDSSAAASSPDASTGGDGDLEGDLDTIAADVGSGSTEGYAVGDVVTDERITGDFDFVYEAETDVFHYAPFDYNGNRTYTGETLDASEVDGFDPSSAETGTTRGVMFDPITGKASIEHSGTVPDTTNDSLVSSNAVLTAANVLDSLDNSNDTMGPFQTEDFYTGSDNNNTGETLTVGGDATTNDTTTTTTGTDGTNGTDGTSGTDGTNGTDGATGTDGSDGADGADGAKGEQGAAGRNGVSLGSSPIAGGFFDSVFEVEDVLQPELLHLAKLIYS